MPLDHDIPHRKNAAEWLMWITLQPLRWFLVLRAASARRRRHGGLDAEQ